MHYCARISDPLLTEAMPKWAMDILLCYLVKRMLAARQSGTKPVMFHIRVIPYSKRFTMKNQVILISPSGTALSLLKTQYAKKPKNPV